MKLFSREDVFMDVAIVAIVLGTAIILGVVIGIVVGLASEKN